jgi:hypothetical protein
MSVSTFQELLLILLLGLLVFWIYAECRLKLPVRIGAGIACLLFIGTSAYFVHHVESHFHKEALSYSELALGSGKPALVLQALHTYNTIAATGSTFQAAMEMDQLLHDSLQSLADTNSLATKDHPPNKTRGCVKTPARSE